MANRLTFIVPAYKVGKYLRECLQSIAAQPEKDVSVIVVDDGSPDDSGAIADEFAARDARFSVIHQKNAGVSVARNAGIAQSDGEWLWLVDGDDWIAANAVARLYRALDAQDARGADMLLFQYEKAPVAGGEKPRSGKLRALSRDEIAELCRQNVYTRADSPLSDIPVKSASFCLYRAAFLRASGVRFDPSVRKGQDSLFNFEALSRCQRAAYLDDALYFYRRNDGSVSVRYNPNAQKAELALLNAYRSAVAREGVDDARMRERLRCHAMLMSRVCLCLGFCHADNPAPYAARRQAFLAYLRAPELADAFSDIRETGASPLGRALYGCIGRGLFAPLNAAYRLYTAARRRRRGG